MILRLAFRNILRNRRRTTITEFSIIIGVMAIVCVGSFMKGMKEGWSRDILDSTSGHITIATREFFESGKAQSAKSLITDVGGVYKAIDTIPGILGAVGKISFGGMVGNEGQSTTFFGWGLDLDRLDRALPLAFAKVVQGTGLKKGDEKGAVLGVGLAKSLNVTVGQPLLLVGNTVDGQMNAVEVVVRGFIQSGEKQLDDNSVMASLSIGQQLLAVTGQASQVLVRINNDQSIDKVRHEIESASRPRQSNLVAHSWLEVNQIFKGVTAMFDNIAFVVGLILFLVVAAGVTNTILMSVFERAREIGTIRAIGTLRGQVARLFLTESLIIGVVGILGGVLLGGAISLVSGHFGITLPPPPGAVKGYIVHPIINLRTVIGASVIVFVMSILSALYPAMLASRMNPVDAIRRT
jgi:putative ABC transport system permease protein